MRSPRHLGTFLAALAIGLLLVPSGQAASLTQISRSAWVGNLALPGYVQMYLYVPDKRAANPPIVVSAHSCSNTATGQMGSIPITRAAADKNGFLLILPDNPGQNCWDVGSKASLTHDGGGDTQAVAQMVKYALSKYGGDATRVYIFGGSSGAMMTQAMLAVYPDLFKAGSARAGVPAGCWADGYSSGNQWSGPCAGGTVSKTAQQWGDLVRAMDPGYTGHRPRVQLFQGEADETIRYDNMAESTKEWTNVLGLATTPTSSDTGYKAAGAKYDRSFWRNACGYTVLQAWSSPGGSHSMAYEEAEILRFFGLDVAGGPDPEPSCSGAGDASGTAGSGGAGAAGARGHGSDGGSGTSGAGGGSATGVPGTGGASARGGAPDTGGASGGGGSDSSTGGPSASGGHDSGTGGRGDSGGTPATGGTSGMGATGGAGSSVVNPPSSSGDGCAMGTDTEHPAGLFAGATLLALALARRRLTARTRPSKAAHGAGHEARP